MLLLSLDIAQTNAAIGVPPTPSPWAWFALTCFVFFGFGLLVSVGVVYYAAKSGSNPLAPLTALGGGLVGSAGFASLSAAIGKAIEGLPVEITWAQAGIVTSAGFIVGTFLTATVAWLYVRRYVINPVRQRFGPIQAATGWVTLTGRFEPLGAWLNRVTRSVEMDAAWDEFSEAALQFFRKLDSDSRFLGKADGSLFDAGGIRTRPSFDLFLKALQAGSTSARPPLSIRRAIEVIQPVLEPLIETLTSRLRQNSLNFTVWRVHQERDELEHLISFPFECGDGQKAPLRIWKTDARVRPATCAAEAMLTRRYLILDDKSAREQGWDIRRLGSAYSQVGCMPIPADGNEPWAVLCAEIRDGQLPMSSTVMKRILSELSVLLNRLSSVASSRTIDKTRTLTEHVSAESRKGSS